MWKGHQIRPCPGHHKSFCLSKEALGGALESWQKSKEILKYSCVPFWEPGKEGRGKRRPGAVALCQSANDAPQKAARLLQDAGKEGVTG